MVDSEFLLLMCHNYSREDDNNRTIHFPVTPYILTEADRKRLYDVGIRTAHEQPAWQTLEPSKGNYNFDYLDNIIKTNRNAGIKSLIQIHGWRIPKWIPNEWRAKTKEGVYEDEMLSMWNEEAQTYSDNLYQMLDNRYKDYKDVMFFFGEWQGGEGIMRPTHCYHDHAALENYKSIYGTSAVPDLKTSPETKEWLGNTAIKHFLRKSRILYPKFHELWNMQQHLMDTWDMAFLNFNIPDIIKAYRTTFPDACLVSCQCTYYDNDHKQDNVEFVDSLRFTYNMEVIVEAMYCAGLPITTPKAIAQGFRGQLVRPAFEKGAARMEDWMVDNIRKSNDLWRKSYEDRQLLSRS